MTFGSQDKAVCALLGNGGQCKKDNGKKKFWMTFYYGYGEFHITKVDRFSQMSSEFSSYDSHSPSTGGEISGSSTSTSLVQQYFAIRALYFKVRGVTSMTITFSGDISKIVSF